LEAHFAQVSRCPVGVPGAGQRRLRAAGTSRLIATGRLAPWIGHSPIQTFLAWGILLILVLPSWSSLPRLVMASVPSLLLMSGTVDMVLRQASVPAWLAWVLFGFLSLVLSARLYLFAVLPTLGACWLLSRPG
jgi:hypothetical protein